MCHASMTHGRCDLLPNKPKFCGATLPEMTASVDPLPAGTDDPAVLAVYGTLAPGESNHREMEGIDGRWEPAVMRGHRFTTVWRSNQGYPGFIADPAGPEQQVLLFRSTDLADHWERLDEFEGSGYRRRLITATTTEGEKVPAWTYEVQVEPGNTIVLHGAVAPGGADHHTVSHLLAKPGEQTCRFEAAIRGWEYPIGWGPAEGWDGLTVHPDGNLVPVTALFDADLDRRLARLDQAMGDGFVRREAELISTDGSRLIGRASVWEARPDA